ncbi:MAG TPA: biotin--[acetyl-CoA-carboxylase] ligase [Candidatus Cloacimonadota bacterium]|jgi:BirA family biotin operon repressor/biotin-[acetyl-CoA-carboxylase] ligase|nr:biotin--[acetyl-CoA-carboxylase] ligase [Candidatus Cloacimonadota bacterium]HOF59699.1 biotin--[acetyl-CoA-carboxylase] ligase [Candidatus Cloacimonadota bacterium]HOR58974.1 biotin--[acetyl-CoA-carboxylase] ligase [Candidatus Cloacimonadota bacterium]HPB09354.1 biotin--[acetyl-CoA-carboxylase] ligase [Candidatus Cloacimonadota bacterium]HPL23202.1 biotin--[acetyl-CoA-carboxylase] ligase [Candidatus Cloacimonadota bacterium]
MRNICKYKTLDSTMEEYFRLLDACGSRDRHVLTSQTQYAGRGRDGADWQSPAGGLYLTFDLLQFPSVPSFALYIGYCVHKLLASLFSFEDLKIKWPNDIYLGEAKLAGILCRHQVENGRYVIGLGINTNTNIDEVKLEDKIANMSDNIGFPVSNTLLASLIVHAVERDAAMLTDPHLYLEYCDQHLYAKNKQAEIVQQGLRINGTIRGLDAEGALILDRGGAGLSQVTHGSLRVLPE